MMTQQVTNEPSVTPHPEPVGPPKGRGRQLVLGLIFGVVFGFLLQKGGVGKYHVLVGMLLLEDFTVLQVMLSAVVVGMLGIYALHAAGLVELHIKPTRYGANTLGGVLFGIGFALAAYCPGTSAAALGQGNYDALAVMLGLMAGSYVFAEASGWIARTINRWGDRGELTLDRLLGMRLAFFLPVLATLLVLVLAAVHFFFPPTS
jgi:uncharacterized membrane protein YedE/YeeE